jgi:hypothetical protein
VYCNIIRVRSIGARARIELCKNTHVQIFGLIEELIQIHGFMFVLCVLMLNDMIMNVCFLLHICFICCVYDVMFDLEV